MLLLTDGPHTMDMLSAVTSGFGMAKRHKARTLEEAFDLHKSNPIDLIILDCSTAEMDGIAITRRLRTEFEGEKSETPILAVAGHASQVQIGQYRDAGASFVVAKPVAPGILLQRILWLAKDMRDLVNTPTFRGPDRRVRATGLPAGIEKGRRATDLVDTARDRHACGRGRPVAAPAQRRPSWPHLDAVVGDRCRPCGR